MLLERIQRPEFDSLLNLSYLGPNRNAELVLTIRVFLERCDPHPELVVRTIGGIPSGPPQYSPRPGTNLVSDGMGGSANILRWEDTEWTTWSDSLERIVLEAVNGTSNRGRFWMKPSAYWGVGWPAGEDWGYYPNVKCLFNMVRVLEAARAQRVIRCYRLAGDTGDLRPFMSRGARGGMLSNRDTTLQPLFTGTSQIRAVHEFFHALGMQHVNYPYERDTVVGGIRSMLHLESVAPNDISEYGATPGQRANIIGGGMDMEGWNFWPWLNRLQKHLDASFRAPQVEWSMTAHRPLPWPRVGVLDLPLRQR